MKIYVRVYQARGEVLLAVCDEELLGKVQFMDMETYETFEIERPEMELEEGVIYRLIKVGKRYYPGKRRDL
ncbi:hypothetical protein [Thermococcus sp. P6]|uniref:hypothetical protein n=1 Tax=Thermococcus sp. P6 TaxID=122420 RepID=UPI0012FE6216|nr:hypothetical protein [Thermococcus sp. P6]